MTIDLTGISYGQYDIYVYVTNTFGGTRRATVTDGSTTFFIGTVSNDATVGSHTLASSTTFGSIEDGTYVVFSGLTGVSQSLTINALTAAITGNSQGDEEPAVAGLQIVQVPEPASLVLMGLGGLLMLGRSRRA